MKLAFAESCAARLVAWLGPFCHRVEVAGSVRRKRPECGDIDLVITPMVEESRGLFGEGVGTTNLCAVECRRRVAAEGWQLTKDGDSSLSLVTQGATPLQVDVWFAPPETFGTVWLCRTGSKEHNVLLCQRAAAAGGHWQPHQGVSIGPKLFAAATEADIYRALRLPFIEPSLREAQHVVELCRRHSHLAGSCQPAAVGQQP